MLCGKKMQLISERLRSKLLFILLFFSCLLCLTGCSNQPQQIQTPVIFADNVMTINYRILIGDKLTSEQRLKIQQIIQNTFTEIDLIYNKWNPRSEISLLNQLSVGQEHVLSPQLFEFFKHIDFFVKLTDGRFDPTVEPLYQLWKSHLEKNQLPPQEEIDLIKPAIGWDKVIFTEGKFQKLDSRTQLDFGGIAKGYCVDLLIERLTQSGLNHLFVEWGGEIRTTGRHPAGRPWSIYISKLGNTNPNEAVAQLNLINQAIATSGDYYQSWTINMQNGQTKTFCHIFNPITFSPLEVKAGSIASASLMASDCLTADTLAKVLMFFETAEEAEAWATTLQTIYPTMTYWMITR